MSAFIDDILVYSTTWADHLVHLDDVLHRLETAGLTASPSKTTNLTTLPKLRTVAPSKLDLSTKLPVPIPAATLQDRYTTECAENKKPVLINFGRMHELPPTATLQDAITWSADLEKDLVGTEPVNDEISVI